MTPDGSAEERVRGFARACVQSGLMTAEEVQAEVVEVIGAELPERAAQADELAATWVVEAHDGLRADQRDWPESTDHDRLQSAFSEMEMLDVSVVQGCEDHAAAQRVVDESVAAGAGLRGVLWFTRADVWHAVDEGVLEMSLWPGDAARSSATAEPVPDDELRADVLGVLEKHGLRAVTEEGRVVVDAHWQRRIST